MLMALYPIHQTYGQLSGSLFLATDQTRLYRNIGVISMFIGLIITLFILLPTKFGGLAAGSGGLAFKMIIVQFISVNIQLWFNLKYIQLNFYKFLLHQIYVLALFLILSKLSALVINYLHLNYYLDFTFSGILYCILIGFSVIIFPQIIGFSRKDIKRFMIHTFRLVKRKCQIN
jgi:hypothetical protein